MTKEDYRPKTEEYRLKKTIELHLQFTFPRRERKEVKNVRATIF
jgi:hypothetical protein